jgi:serine beta-lactamase-like protein LACTB, mitochondrial
LIPAAVDRSAKVRMLVAAEVDAQKLVAISFAVAQEGKIVLEEHLGFENREAGIATSPHTMYRWASISKPVTAIAAMQLAETGKLNLDVDVRTLVPEFPEKPWTVTPRGLLCHQGGIVHYSNGEVIKLPRPTTPENPYEDVILALGTFKESPLVCEPGTKYSYTTHGYMLLGAAVERATGAKFWPLVRETIAQPAGMTSFRPDYQWEAIEHRAVGYEKNNEGQMVRSTDTDVSWKLAGGGFISTVGDLSRFSIALLDNKLVTPETLAEMSTKQNLKSGETTNYGLGLNVGKLADKAIIFHSGSQEKTATFLLMVPGDRLSVAVMCNTEGASLGSLTRAIAREWLGIAEEPPAPSESPR